MQGEIDRLNLALRAILDAKTAEEVRSIALEALGYNVSAITGPFVQLGLDADGVPVLRLATP